MVNYVLRGASRNRKATHVGKPRPITAVAIKFIKPTNVSVFLGLLLAALMRMLWFWLIGKKITDPLGLTAILIAMIALGYIGIFRRRA